MIRIPTGNAGQAQIARAPAQQVRPEGMATARALENLGATGVQIGMDNRAAQTRLDRIEMLRQQEVAEAATRARDSTALHIAEDSLRALSDDINTRVLSGQVPKAEALQLWEAEAKKRVDESLPNFSEGVRQNLQPRLMGLAGTLGRSVRNTVERKDRDDITADLVTGLEQLERQYRTDPARAEASMNALIDAIGPFSNYSATEREKLRQGWKEKAQYTLAFEAVSAGRNDPAALTDARKMIETLADIDPQRRAQLIDRADGYAARHAQEQELRAARAARAQEARLNQARAEFDAASAIIMQGKVLRPEMIERVTAATAGTPFQAAFGETLKSMSERTAFGAQPLAVQAQALQQMRATLNTTGTDPGSERQVAALQAIHDKAREEYAADPLVAALDRGLLPELAPIALNDLGSLTQSIAQRVSQARVVQAHTGRPVSPLTQAEAEQVGAMLSTLPVQQKSTAVAGLARATGPEVASALARQIAERDKPLGLAMAAGVAQTAKGRFTSELILRGAQALKDKTVVADNTRDSNWRAEIAEQIGNAYQNEEVRQAAIDAAYFITAGLASENNGRAGGRTLRNAVSLATGGIVERNGVKVPLPYGMDEDTFGRRLDEFDPAALGVPTVYVNGQPVPAAAFVQSMRTAPLIHAGPGRYAVQAGGRLATRDAEGRQALILEIR